jgi:dihydrofolate reductase
MAKLVYIVNASLDGYCEDPGGGIDFGDPDEEYFGRINDIERGVGTYLYGRRMYEAMLYWETAPTSPDQPPWVVDFTTRWRAADKVVFSRTLDAVSSERTTLEAEFDAEAVRRTKADAAHDITVGGAALAAVAFAAGLVDECHLFFWPRVLGGGKPALPTGRRIDLELLDHIRTSGGVVQVHLRVRR